MMNLARFSEQGKGKERILTCIKVGCQVARQEDKEPASSTKKAWQTSNKFSAIWK